MFPKSLPNPDLRKDQIRDVTCVVANWIQFVWERTSYLEDDGRKWPTFADVHHSDLLRRMLNGEKPMAEEDYKKYKGR
jgi:hypothetical protein